MSPYLNLLRSALFLPFLLLPLLVAASAEEKHAQSNSRGAVATVNPYATRLAMAVLKDGGNAVDAAVVAALALGVVDSHNSGIGGGSLGVVHWANGEIEAIDGRETAPALAHRDMYISDGKAQTDWSRNGALAVATPGSLKMYEYMLDKGGKKSLAGLLNRAATLADGHELVPVSAQRIARVAKKLAEFPEAAGIFLDAEGKPWPAGHRLVQTDLAKTYRAIAREGTDYFYSGEFAKKLDRWMRDNGGLLRYEDLKNYKVMQREVVDSEYRGYRVLGMSPPSSGGVHLAQILNILEHFDLHKLSSVDRTHVIAEAMKLAYADRAHWLGDSDFTPVPRGLTAKSYAAGLAPQIKLDRALTGVSYGTPKGADIDLYGKHTTHISAVDADGNWVAITATINTTYGSKVVIPGTGVVLNNEMDDFSIQPGVPNVYGLVGSEANSVAAGKRPLSTMTPTLIMKDGKPVMALGAAGGSTILTQVVQNLVNVIDLGMGAEAALAAPRIHHQWAPDMLFIGKQVPAEDRKGLEAKGHKTRDAWGSGVSQLILRRADGSFEAASEPRIVAINRAED